MPPFAAARRVKSHDNRNSKSKGTGELDFAQNLLQSMQSAQSIRDKWFAASLACQREEKLLAERTETEIIYEGFLEKRGEYPKDSPFLRRWVTVSRHQVSYSELKGRDVLGQIPLQEIVGIATRHGLPESGNQDATEKFLLWRKSCRILHADLAGARSFALKHHEFSVFTSTIGVCRGRVYVLKEADQNLHQKWMEVLCRILTSLDDEPPKSASSIEVVRSKMRWYYNNPRIQYIVVFLIFVNFLVNLVEVQLARSLSQSLQDDFDLVDKMFVAIFTIELAINFFVSSAFFQSAWNWFDLFTIASSLVVLADPNMPSASIMRIFRVFRVFRILRRVESLSALVSCLAYSVGPVIRAFWLVSLVTGIYAIVGVNFFSRLDPENFGGFFLSFYTLFEAMTFNYIEICRNLMEISGHHAAVGLYFLTFNLVVSLLLMNVVIAVLLDNFASASQSRAKEPQTDLDNFSGVGVNDIPLCPLQSVVKKVNRHWYELDEYLEMLFHTIRGQGMVVSQGKGPSLSRSWNLTSQNLPRKTRDNLSNGQCFGYRDIKEGEYYDEKEWIEARVQNLAHGQPSAHGDLKTPEEGENFHQKEYIEACVSNLENEQRSVDENHQEPEDIEVVERKRLELLKIYISVWRFRGLDACTLSQEEFERGFQDVCFPPLLFPSTMWEEYVLEARCASLHTHSGEYRIGLAGFKKMMKTAMTRDDMRLLEKSSVSLFEAPHAIIMGLSSLNRASNEAEKRSRLLTARKAHRKWETSVDDLMHKLLAEMDRMNSHIDRLSNTVQGLRAAQSNPKMRRFGLKCGRAGKTHAGLSTIVDTSNGNVSRVEEGLNRGASTWRNGQVPDIVDTKDRDDGSLFFRSLPAYKGVPSELPESLGPCAVPDGETGMRDGEADEVVRHVSWAQHMRAVLAVKLLHEKGKTSLEITNHHLMAGQELTQHEVEQVLQLLMQDVAIHDIICEIQGKDERGLIGPGKAIWQAIKGEEPSMRPLTGLTPVAQEPKPKNGSKSRGTPHTNLMFSSRTSRDGKRGGNESSRRRHQVGRDGRPGRVAKSEEEQKEECIHGKGRKKRGFKEKESAAEEKLAEVVTQVKESNHGDGTIVGSDADVPDVDMVDADCMHSAEPREIVIATGQWV